MHQPGNMCHSKVAVRQKVALLVLSVLTKEALSAQFVPQGNIQLQMPLFAQNAAQDQYQLRLPQVAISVLLENTLVTVNVFPVIPESSLRKGQRIVPSAPLGRLLPLLEARLQNGTLHGLLRELLRELCKLRKLHLVATAHQ